jgi:hypothetical protein
MTTLRFGRYAIGFCLAVAVPAGCGGTQAGLSTSLSPAAPAQSWMAPESQSGDLLYVSSAQYQNGFTNVYTFPGGKLVGGLGNAGYTYGLCSDKNGNVFITTQYAIYEYPHGRASPISMISDPQGAAFGCSVDPTSGKLAVVSGGGVAIYRPAGHNQWYLPQLYSFKREVFSGTYDPAGNLFVDGLRAGGKPLFVELPKGASKFVAISLNQTIPNLGNLQWDGKYLAVGADQNLHIHRFAMHGTQGTQIGLLGLNGVQEVRQFWVQGSTLIGPAFESTWGFSFWKYPAGGSPTKTIQQTSAYGATVSLAPH